jgi:hypothetical protein
MSAQPAPMTFSLETQIAEVGFEIRKRREVYPNLVRVGKMSAAEMDYKIECMLAVRASLRSLRGSPDVEDVDVSAAPAPAPRLALEPAERNAFGHSCAVCGASPAPFGYGFPKATEFYCRDHRPAA